MLLPDITGSRQAVDRIAVLVAGCGDGEETGHAKNRLWYW